MAEPGAAAVEAPGATLLDDLEAGFVVPVDQLVSYLTRAATTSYLFARATTDYAELRLAGLFEIDDLTPSFGWKLLDHVTDGVLRDSDFDDPTPHDVVHSP